MTECQIPEKRRDLETTKISSGICLSHGKRGTVHLLHPAETMGQAGSHECGLQDPWTFAKQVLTSRTDAIGT